jgi:hypothetical protein
MRKPVASNLPQAEVSSSGVPQGAPGAVGGSGSEPTDASRPAVGSTGRQRRATTNIRPNVGKREVKEYPLTESDIETLGLTKGGSTFFFSLATLLIGFVLNSVNESSTWDVFCWRADITELLPAWLRANW